MDNPKRTGVTSSTFEFDTRHPVGFQVNVLNTFKIVASSLGSGLAAPHAMPSGTTSPHLTHCFCPHGSVRPFQQKPEMHRGHVQLFRSNTCHTVNLENNYLTEMWSGSEAGLYVRTIDLMYHSTLGLRVIN